MSSNHNLFWTKGRAKAELSWGSSAYQPDTLLLGQTGLLRCLNVYVVYIWIVYSHQSTAVVWEVLESVSAEPWACTFYKQAKPNNITNTTFSLTPRLHLPSVAFPLWCITVHVWNSLCHGRTAPKDCNHVPVREIKKNSTSREKLNIYVEFNNKYKWWTHGCMFQSYTLDLRIRKRIIKLSRHII